MSNMFCYQCEQTSAGKGCSGRFGVCGKKEETAKLQDALTGALITLAQALHRKEQFITEETHQLMLSALFSTVTNVNFQSESIQTLINRIHTETQRICHASSCPSVPKDYDMLDLWNAPEDLRSLKSLILFGLRGMAAYAWHAKELGYENERINLFFYKALRAIGNPTATVEKLFPLALEVGEYNYRCMELLDRANTECFGQPTPASVTMKVALGPFIIVTGHDYRDLELLLQQTEGKGINIYTHGEMLSAHGYPELRKYPHLKGHFGTAWQNQQAELEDVPAPVLFTTNCLMPPRYTYSYKIFTTGLVSYPGIPHIDEKKDFSPVIQKALGLGGYRMEQYYVGTNGGSTLSTGHGWRYLLSNSELLVDAIRSGKIRHIFLVGGCDGAKGVRGYYTDFVQSTPDDTLVLTLACGKYRFNDLNLGTVAGIPRLLDLGQCNDAYGAIRIAASLADAFHCRISDLPLSMVLSWYEQKAVAILLTLLYLGVQNILLGPTLPAFLSPNIYTYLTEKYHIAKISNPETDLQLLLRRKSIVDDLKKRT